MTFIAAVLLLVVGLIGLWYARRRPPIEQQSFTVSEDSFFDEDAFPLDPSSTFATAPILDQYLVECTRTATVPKLVWTFWFSPTISDNRKKALHQMSSVLQVPVIVLTLNRMQPFLRWPVHPAVQYLSGNHKSDYFRIYFLLYYGGGYTDIKPMVESWKPFFDEFNDPRIWIVGVPEVEHGVGAPPGRTFPSDYYQRMICNGFFIARARNPYFARVHAIQHEILDRVYPILRQATEPPKDRCCKEPTKEYPLRWGEMMGEIMSVVAADYGYHGHFSRKMKLPNVTDYL